MYQEHMFSSEEKIAVLIVHRTCRHSGIDPNELLLSFINKFGFGNREKLETTGLNIAFCETKNYILNNPFQIGLLLFGLSEPDIYLCEYITKDGNPINITIHSVCNSLFKKYFTQNEINELCKSTPLYSYYSNNI